MTYKHLTREERYQIYALRRQGIGLAVIAAELKRSRSTITRELKRNAGSRGYRPARAHERACSRQSARRNSRQFDEQQWAQVHRYLGLKLSPEQVSGRLKVEGTMSISYECIYLHIYEDKRAGGLLARGLRCQKAQRKRYGSGQERRGTLKDRVSIELRPAIVDERSRIGDWEGDTVVGKGHQGVLLTLVARKSRYTLARQLDCKGSAGITEAVIALLRPYKSLSETITFDNGKELAQHTFIADSLQAQRVLRAPVTLVGKRT